MKPIYYVVIGVAALLLAAVLVTLLIVWLKKRKKPVSDPMSEETLLIESRARIARNAKTAELLCTLAGEETASLLRAAGERIAYLTPSAKEEVKRVDERLAELLAGMRAALEAGQPVDPAQIDVLLAEREIATI